MQSWSKERRGEKQNQEMQTFQIKTRQYTNLTMLRPNANNTEDSSYSPKQTPKIENNTQNSFNFPNSMDKAQKASFKQRYNLEDDQQNVAPFSPYNPKVNQQRNEIGKISRNKNLQLDYRKYLKDTPTVSKSPIKKEYFDKSYGQNLNMKDSSQSQSFKRENAKKKGIQMKMTNIDCINDQISSLLNMVNKNKRINDNSGSKSKTRYDSKEAYDYRQNSFQKYRPKIHITPSPSKNTSIQANKKYINKQQRDRVYSELGHQFREGFDSIKYQNKKQKYIACNEEDSRRNEQVRNNMNYKYSPKQHYDNQKYLQNKSFERSTSPYQRPQTKSAYSKKQAYPERQYEKTASPYRQYNKKTSQTFYDRTSKRNNQKTQYSGYKYFNKQRPEQFVEQKLPQYVPKYKKLRQKLEKGQNQMLPLSIQVAKYTDKTPKNQRSTFAFEEHMQNIRGKIAESQQKTLKYQQRLRQQDNSGANNEQKLTGRLYKKNGAQFHNGFQLKIYPVQVDRPNTLKIAQKLADQIQIDKKLALPRMLLQQQEDQYKWSQLELSLKSKELKMTKFQIQQLLELSPQEKDSSSHFKAYQSHKNIGVLLLQAQRHWQKQVYGCSSQKGLKMQNFNSETIDSSRNGYVSAEDLAHFINTFTGRKYRSKDTTLIYRRLQLLEGSKNNENVQFSTFVRAIAI